MTKIGLDDFFVGGGTVEQLVAMTEAPDQAWKTLEKAREQHAHSRLTILPFTQWGAAQRLEEALGQRFTWCPRLYWYAWNEDEGVWVQNAEYILLREAVRALEDKSNEEIRALADLDSDKAVGLARKFSLDMQSVGNVRGAMKFLETLKIGTWEAFDTDPNKLTVANGTLVFGPEGVTKHDHSPDDFITKKSPVFYDPAARAPFWDETLALFVPDVDMRAFLQRLAGSLLVSVGTAKQVIPFFYGDGGRGKSTFAEGMKVILGRELVRNLERQTIQSGGRSGGAAAEDLMALLGCRLAIAEETEDPDGKRGQTLDIGMIKKWSGGGEISARPLWGKQIQFRPTFTLLLIANSAPDFKDRTDGIWRRLLVIPFNATLPKGRKPMDALEVTARLQAEASGILNWAIQGYEAYMRDGLNPPAEVLLAGQELRKSQDWLANFIAECTHEDPEGFISTAEAHEAFIEWRRGDKEIPDQSQRKLTAELAAKWGKPKPHRVPGREGTPRGWKGVALGEPGEDVSLLGSVSLLPERSETDKTAGQSPVDLDCFTVSLKTPRVYDEDEVQEVNSQSPMAKEVKQVKQRNTPALTCGDAVSLPEGEKRNRPRVLGLVATFDFSTGTTSTEDAAWRSLYRKSG